ncbi:alpha/beta hydrolase [Marinimicrobium alkaliphilum]|uniref:alpha/beta hydrolase n=1 Tax=Marinimicrobium alkaliphilum TaxID=2202654 RepID=UPI000DB9C7FC|nr:alpha/beta hydrolase [Marinimicrobium alkaliphilum]
MHLSLPSPRAGAPKNPVRRLWRWLALLALPLSVSASAERVGDVDFRACTLSAEGRERQAQCAELTLPENYDVPDGPSLALSIVRLPARRPDPDAPRSPLLLLAGGPGQGASEAYLHVTRAFPQLARARDFYLIDQRGTGRSNRLACPDTDPDALLHGDLDPEQVRALTEACLAQLPGDPRYYTTSVALRDFEAAREALGIAQWNLFSVSYGTRVAQHYMRRHPKAVRTAVLDSPVPSEHTLGPEIAELSQKVLDTLYRRCDQDEACQKAFPDLRSHVDNLFARLDDAPITLSAERFADGELIELTLTRMHLEALVRLYLYHTRSLALLPPILYEAAANERFAPLARAAIRLTDDLGDAMAFGMHNAVVCTEDAPFFPDADNDSPSYLGGRVMETLREVCRHWPIGLMDEDLKAPLNSAIPTLLLSGEYDPITPPAYAELAMTGLSNAKHLSLKGQGHFVSTAGCMPHVLTRFIDSASPSGLQLPCLERIESAPLFINFNGPSP